MSKGVMEMVYHSRLSFCNPYGTAKISDLAVANDWIRKGCHELFSENHACLHSRSLYMFHGEEEKREIE